MYVSIFSVTVVTIMEAVSLVLSVFSREQKIQLLPFVVTSVFFLVQPYDPESSFLGVIFKILPILSLIGYVVYTRSQFPRKNKTPNVETLLPEDPYSFCILAGLCVALVGDIFVAIPYLMFLGGFLFMIVYTIYIIGIEIGGRHKGCTGSFNWFFGLLYVNTWLCIQAGFESYIMKIFMFIYLIPLFLAAWKATAAVEENRSDKSALMACIGACLFIFSDWLVILEYNEYPIPFVQFMYMLTYYGAQAGWALSTSNFH